MRLVDAFVEHRVRIHLDADQKVGASGSRFPAGRAVLTGVTGRSERCGERTGTGDAGETAEELASIGHDVVLDLDPELSTGLPDERFGAFRGLPEVREPHS
jgi:hypothetical protein